MTIDLTIGVDEHARFTPSISNVFARLTAPGKAAHHRPLPNGGTLSDLNYLDPACPFFHYNASLYSAAFGADETQATIVTERDRSRTIIVGDSGGYSAISGSLKQPFEKFRRASLAWQEQHCDVGIILDDPTRSLNASGGSKRFEDCLANTLDSLKFAIDYRSRSDMLLLTVMQGRNRKEAKAWRDAVGPFQRQFEGIALAGDTKLDLALWAEGLIKMRDKGQFDRLQWLHVLGTTRPGFAVMLTGLQRALRRHLTSNLRVSFDSSLAFRVAQVNKQLTTGLAYDRKIMKFQRYKFPDHWSALDRNARFPFSSPLGDISRFKDFNPANANSATGLGHGRHADAVAPRSLQGSFSAAGGELLGGS